MLLHLLLVLLFVLIWVSAKEILEFMDELHDNHKQLVEGQKLLSEQMDDLANQFQFWKDIVFGGKTGTSPKKCSSGSLICL